eukprot:INCI4855.3.p1 GENE.INCI4855.3~~INCI4855.3.p1  ORF type:complete len:371 (-),score=43.45 INCI4855.3:570-1682(-)
MGGCRCAPLRVPLKRRLQTLAIALNFPPLTLLYCVVVWALLMIFANTYVRALLVLYTIWSFVDRAPATGGWNLPRLTRFVRSSWVHRYAFEFFGPTSSIVKTCELDPSKRYLFGYHPHGIICVGAALAFATGGAGFSDIFPGVDVSLLVLKPLFRVPFYREWLLAHNILSAGRKTCINLLTGKYETADDGVDDCNAGETGPKSKGGKCKPTKGRSICLAIGGAREGLDAVPNTMQLTILHRKGFVKVAVEAGASLVPVIGFGENELFNQVTTGCVGRAQKQFQRRAGFFVPVFWGRGCFNYTFGLLPHRRPLNIVVGAPIDCPKMIDMDAPETRETVDRIHKEYMEALQKLYNDHRSKYLPADAKGLVFK